MVVADAPARALVIFGDGLVQSLSPSHSHLHALAASGACGFLALRHIPPHVDITNRDLFEMQQLLDVHRFYVRKVIDKADEPFGDSTSTEYNIPSISERFMGMKAAIATNSKSVSNLGRSLGFSLFDDKVKLVNEETFTCNTDSKLANPSMVASQLLEMLGLSSPCLKDTNSFELVLLHLGCGSSNDRDSVGQAYLDWMDALVGEVKTLMQPGTKASDHLYLALVLGYGDNAVIRDNVEVSEVPSLEQLDGLPPNLRALRPQQTYKMKDGKPVDDVRDHHPLLVVHQMDGVTRRDHATMLSFEEFQKNGGNLTILADRFLYEIAFKLWKAPKYGA